MRKEFATFSPDEAKRMSEAFDAAWQCLVDGGSVLAHPYQQNRNRELLALKIIELVRLTPPDVTELRDAALHALGFLPPGVECPPKAA
jgi:hypothetical protein